MQTVIMSVVNSGNDNKTYRVGDLNFNIVGGQTKNVTISLPDDAGFIVWLVGDSDLVSTIIYGQNDPKNVIIVDADYDVDPLDGLVMSDEATPVAMSLPSYTTMFSGDVDGGVGNIVTLRRNSTGAVTVVPEGTDTIDGDNATKTFAGVGAIELQAVYGGYEVVGGTIAFS